MPNLWITPEELGEDYEEHEFAYQACKSASFVLWGMSGRKYPGITTVTERYITGQRWLGYGPARLTTAAGIVDGNIVNVPVSEAGWFAEILSDGRSPDSRIKLRGRPVTHVHAVRRVDGTIVNPDSYYLVDHSTLQAYAGVPWTPGNTEVTYSYGTPPPEMGKMAARELAQQFILAWANDPGCRLPARVTSVSRQSINYTILDSQDFLDSLRTGLYIVDLFLKTTNPAKAYARARVISPDMPRARRNAPKGLRLGPTALDITVNGDGGTNIIPLDLINAAFLIDGTGWVPRVTIRSWAETNSLELDPGAISIDEDAADATVSVTYTDAKRVLGMVDPGTWDLYASRPSIVTPGETELVYICSGNLKISMAGGALSAFTIGE